MCVYICVYTCKHKPYIPPLLIVFSLSLCLYFFLSSSLAHSLYSSILLLPLSFHSPLCVIVIPSLLPVFLLVLFPSCLHTLFLSLHSFLHFLLSLPSSCYSPSLLLSCVSVQTPHPSAPIPSPYWLSPHSFIRILPFTLLYAAPGQWSSRALERSALRLHVNSSHISLLADLLLLICSFQAAESALQGCSSPPCPGVYCHEDVSQANWRWRLNLALCVCLCVLGLLCIHYASGKFKFRDFFFHYTNLFFLRTWPFDPRLWSKKWYFEDSVIHFNETWGCSQKHGNALSLKCPLSECFGEHLK